MRRLVHNELKEWKDSKYRKPLVMFGARQIGKTYAIIDFGKKEYRNFVYCNFEDNEDLSDIFNNNFNIPRIIQTISALYGVTITTDTLIFFDEIQSCERALTSLKYFYENAPEYHIIAAGSLLGLAVNRGKYSFPVGKVDMVTMYPMNFEEFLLATENDGLIDIIRDAYENFIPLPSILHEKALSLYRIYLVVGGFPEAVKKFIEHQDYNLLRSTQSTITNAYISDMAKYATSSDTIKSMAIYNSIHVQLAKETTKFQYSVVDKKARSKNYELSLEWLKAASVVLPTIKRTEGKMPIQMYQDLQTFKVYYCDVGLLSLKSNIPAQKILHNIDISDKTRGILAESYVAQELTYKKYPLNYWESNNTAEVDFVIQIDGDIIPVEVKSASNTRSKSLSVFVNRYETKYSMRFSTKNFGFENNIKSIPLYALFCLPKNN